MPVNVEDNSLKGRLRMLKHALQKIKHEITQVEIQIQQEEIKASGQLDLEKAIEDEIKHVRNKNGYQ